MKMIDQIFPLTLITVLLLGGLLACGASSPEAERDSDTVAEPTDSPSTDEADDEVEFEPAYPDDVSEEDLSDADREQQEAAREDDEHDHDGEHAHADGTTHSHGEEDGHDHDESDEH